MFELFKDSQGLWRFRVKALNNKIIAVSESYTSKSNAVKGIKSLIKNVHEDTEIKDLENDKIWKLRKTVWR